MVALPVQIIGEGLTVTTGGEGIPVIVIERLVLELRHNVAE